MDAKQLVPIGIIIIILGILSRIWIKDWDIIPIALGLLVIVGGWYIWNSK